VSLEQKYHGYHFLAERLSFSAELMEGKNLWVLIKLLMVIISAERLSFSEEAKVITQKMTEMVKGTITNAL